MASKELIECMSKAKGDSKKIAKCKSSFAKKVPPRTAKEKTASFKKEWQEQKTKWYREDPTGSKYDAMSDSQKVAKYNKRKKAFKDLRKKYGSAKN